MSARIQREHGAKVANGLGGTGSFGLCLCLPGLLIPGFRSPCRVCSPVRRLLLCLAVLPLSLCSLVLSSRFFTFNGHLSQEPDKSLDSSWVSFTWQSKSVISSETGRKKKVSIHMRIQQHAGWEGGASVACWLLSCSKQEKDNDEFSMSDRH